MCDFWRFEKFVLAILIMVAGNISASENKNDATLFLTIQDVESKQVVPARIEVIDAKGTSYIAEDAMLIGGDCGFVPNGVWGEKRYDGTLKDALSKFSTSIKPPHTETTHFYSSGRSTLKLPEGPVTIKVFKGPEYYVGKAEVKVTAGKVIQKTIKISRMTNFPKKGWYSADDHIHIARAHKGVNPLVLKMMQAEDVHVGNILQVGRAHSFSVTPQYAHGPAGLYQEGNYIISSGQENLRTHILGHAITLGAKEKILEKKSYLNYPKFWQQAVEQGAINGMAHYAMLIPELDSDAGLPLFLRYNLLHFMEVLQFNQAQYDTWYDMLNLGFRITPTAGTDYPCDGSRHMLPGQERFYTQVDGSLSYDKWLESVRSGRTFVTTGPLLTFRINGKDIGEEITLDGPADVIIEAEVIYDSERDSVYALELIENGNLAYSYPQLDDSGRIKFKIHRRIEETSWLAVRTLHSKFQPAQASWAAHRTEAHTAPIYVNLKNSLPLASHPRTKEIIKPWLAVLDKLAFELGDDHIYHLADFNERRLGDPVPREVTLNSQESLLAEVEKAKAFFQSYPKSLSEPENIGINQK